MLFLIFASGQMTLLVAAGNYLHPIRQDFDLCIRANDSAGGIFKSLAAEIYLF